METVQSTTKTTSNQTVTAPKDDKKSSSSATAFDATLKGLMKPDGANKVSEEDLFSALIQERIKKEKGDDALKAFQELLATTKQSMAKSDGYIPVEDATKAALIKFQTQGKLTAEEADKMYSQSFAAAQLDGNTEVLFDNRGGPNDPTIAVATIEQALMGSRVKIEKFDSGAEKAPLRSLLEPSTGKSALTGVTAGADGFLWKPESEKDKKLVVLLPPRLSGMVANVRLMGPSGEELETGRYSGNGNGGREHFRFSRAGGSYPDGLTVEAKLTTGEIVRFNIGETSSRSDNAQATSAKPAAPTTPSDVSKDEDKATDNANSSTGSSSGSGATQPL
jgi:hypothetical protein